MLRATGETVAVKVQRPGIGDNIAIDMLLLRQLMGVIDKNQTLVRTFLVALLLCIYDELLLAQHLAQSTDSSLK